MSRFETLFFPIFGTSQLFLSFNDCLPVLPLIPPPIRQREVEILESSVEWCGRFEEGELKCASVWLYLSMPSTLALSVSCSQQSRGYLQIHTPEITNSSKLYLTPLPQTIDSNGTLFICFSLRYSFREEIWISYKTF